MERAGKDREVADRGPCGWHITVKAGPVGDPAAVVGHGRRDQDLLMRRPLSLAFLPALAAGAWALQAAVSRSGLIAYLGRSGGDSPWQLRTIHAEGAARGTPLFRVS